MLDKYIIMDDATLTDETAESGTLAIEGPEAPSIIYALTGVDLKHIPVRGHVTATINSAAPEGASVDAAKVAQFSPPIPCRVIHHSLYGFPGAELLVAREHLAAAWHAAEAAVHAHHGAPIGYRALNALRLEAGIPWFGVDFGEHQIPHEAGLESTHISFTKGCYTGQEIVERVRSRGHVNRRLTGLRFDTTEPPQSGAKLSANGTEAGHVTSAEFSPLLEKPIGMGYVRREYNQPLEIFCNVGLMPVRFEPKSLHCRFPRRSQRRPSTLFHSEQRAFYVLALPAVESLFRGVVSGGNS